MALCCNTRYVAKTCALPVHKEVRRSRSRVGAPCSLDSVVWRKRSEGNAGASFEQWSFCDEVVS